MTHLTLEDQEPNSAMKTAIYSKNDSSKKHSAFLIWLPSLNLAAHPWK